MNREEQGKEETHKKCQKKKNAAAFRVRRACAWAPLGQQAACTQDKTERKKKTQQVSTKILFPGYFVLSKDYTTSCLRSRNNANASPPWGLLT